MPTASQVIAYERSYVGKAKYVNDTQGPDAFDCVGLQDWCLDNFGLLYILISGGVKPQTVYYFYSHFTGPKLPPGTVTVPGDIIIMGDPNASDYHNVFAHIGMVSDKPGYYISAYDPTHGITEYPIPTYSTFKVVWILRTNLPQSEELPVVPVTPMATCDISGGTLYSNASVTGTALVNPLSPQKAAILLAYDTRDDGVAMALVVTHDGTGWVGKDRISNVVLPATSPGGSTPASENVTITGTLTVNP